MSIPDDCRMTESHEWHRADGNIVTVGITQFAADELTDITYVDLAAVGTQIEAGGTLGEIESVKATSELFCAVGGTVTEINEALVDQPELVNDDPWVKCATMCPAGLEFGVHREDTVFFSNMVILS